MWLSFMGLRRMCNQGLDPDCLNLQCNGVKGFLSRDSPPFIESGALCTKLHKCTIQGQPCLFKGSIRWRPNIWANWKTSPHAILCCWTSGIHWIRKRIALLSRNLTRRAIPGSHNTHTAYRPRSKIPRSGDCQNLILFTDRLEAIHTEIKAFRTWNCQELENSLENVDVLYVRQSAKGMIDCKRYHILFRGYQAVSPRV